MMNLEALRRLAGQDISIDFDEGVLILDFGNNVFKFLTDLEKRECYFKIMDAVDAAPEIKVVLSLAEPNSLNEEVYDGYLINICGTDVGLANLGNSWGFKDNIERAKQLCFHRYTIQRRVASKKILIDGLRGTIVTPFFGETLSADLRYATPDMRFSLMHKKYGLHPSGALAFYLPRYLGQGRATELMLTTDSIEAEQALELGLINAIISPEDFVSECLKLAKKVSVLSLSTIASTKLLSTPYKEELDSYFKAEESLVAYSWQVPSRGYEYEVICRPIEKIQACVASETALMGTTTNGARGG
jgi:enoyl-CoA hydratase/carnithine racemase